jgi:hypothetical protein
MIDAAERLGTDFDYVTIDLYPERDERSSSAR